MELALFVQGSLFLVGGFGFFSNVPHGGAANWGFLRRGWRLLARWRITVDEPWHPGEKEPPDHVAFVVLLIHHDLCPLLIQPNAIVWSDWFHHRVR